MSLNWLVGVLIVLSWIGFVIWIFWKEPKIYLFPQKNNPTSKIPKGISPTWASYLFSKRNYLLGRLNDNTPNLAIPLISLAIKEKIKIQEISEENNFLGKFIDFGKKYKILFTPDSKNYRELPEEEGLILNFLLRNANGNQLEISSSSNNNVLRGAYKVLKKNLNERSKKQNYFPKESFTTLLRISPVIVLIILMLLIAVSNDEKYGYIILFFILIIPTLVLITPLSFLLEAPGWESRKLIDQIVGFREYLSNYFSNRKFSFELFESYLPYAVALNIEKEFVKGAENYI